MNEIFVGYILFNVRAGIKAVFKLSLKLRLIHDHLSSSSIFLRGFKAISIARLPSLADESLTTTRTFERLLWRVCGDLEFFHSFQQYLLRGFLALKHFQFPLLTNSSDSIFTLKGLWCSCLNFFTVSSKTFLT
jgi:hypothetical protein